MKKTFLSIVLIAAIVVSNVFTALADMPAIQAIPETQTEYESNYFLETPSNEQTYAISEAADGETVEIDQNNGSDIETGSGEEVSTAEPTSEIETSEESTSSQGETTASEETEAIEEETTEKETEENTKDTESLDEDESTAEIENEESEEDTLNAASVKTVRTVASNTSIESYYTKYGDEYFTKRMYETYDKSTKKYNLTYTVTMEDGTVITGNKDDLYARFGVYPTYARKIVSSSELIIYETFMGRSCFIRFKIVAHAHTVVIDKAVAATTTTTGLTEGSHCSVCGDVIVKQEVIPTLDSHVGWYYANGSWFFYDNYGNMTRGWLYRGTENGKQIWYYFDSNGVMQTGWKRINGDWYYFESSGRMSIGWKYISGVWFYLNANGAMQTGWKWIGNTWYYFYDSGVMATGWLYRGTEGGKEVWYYMSDSGAVTYGWKQIKNVWYFFSYDSGRMAIGWLYRGTEGGKEVWYYMSESGATTYGWKQIKNVWYFFSYDSGRMAIGWLYRGTENNKQIWYYFSSSGAMQTGWRKINGELYFLDRTSGRMATGWLKDNGKWYCLFSDGTVMTGWHFIDDAWYYMETSGAVFVGTMKQDGSNYSFDTDGKLYRAIKDNSNNAQITSEYMQMSVPDRTQLEQSLLEKFDGDETCVICLISWMEGEADFSSDPYLGYLSASAVINSMLDYPSLWKNGAGFRTMSGWGSYYSESRVRARYNNQNLMSSTLRSIYLALKYPVRNVHNCYGLYLSGMYPTYCYYITNIITAEGEPTAVF